MVYHLRVPGNLDVEVLVGMPGPEIYSLTLYPSECGLFNFEDCGDGWTAIQLGSRHWYYHHADNVLENDALGITTTFIFGSGVRSDALYAVGLWGMDDVTFTGDVVPDVGSLHWLSCKLYSIGRLCPRYPARVFWRLWSN